VDDGRSAEVVEVEVTAAGIPPAKAAELILRMSGRFRMPDAPRQVDALARGRKAPVLAR
jgi:hypothetical protein